MDAAQRFERAYILMMTGRTDQALEELQEALVLEPEHPRILVGLAHLLLKRGELFDAEDAARRAIFQAPDYAATHWSLARVLDSAERYDEALEALDRAIELQRHPLFYDLSAWINLTLERGNVALDIVKEALFWMPEDENLLITHAWVCIFFDQRKKARKLLETVLSLYPESKGARSTLGKLERDSGNLVESEKLYREAVELDPDCSANLKWYDRVKKELDQSDHGILGPLYDPVTNKFLRRI